MEVTSPLDMVYTVWPGVGYRFQRLTLSYLQQLGVVEVHRHCSTVLPSEIVCTTRSMLEENPKRTIKARQTPVLKCYCTNVRRQNDGGTRGLHPAITQGGGNGVDFSPQTGAVLAPVEAKNSKIQNIHDEGLKN